MGPGARSAEETSVEKRHALTERILFPGKPAIGVAYLLTDQAVTANARHEVLLGSDAIVSPQILQRSGAGLSPLLKSLDIPVVHDLPGMGPSCSTTSRFTSNTGACNPCPQWAR